MIRWFLPQGIPRPDHLPAGGIAVLRDGPDGGPGLVVGGPWRPGETDWQQGTDGLWRSYRSPNPAEALRLHAPEPAVELATEQHVFLVAVLLRPLAGGLVSAQPRTYTASGFVDQPHLAPLLADLRAAVTSDPEALDEATLAQLAIRILGLTYHLGPTEWSDLGWLTDHLAAQVLVHAAGLTQVP